MALNRPLNVVVSPTMNVRGVLPIPRGKARRLAPAKGWQWLLVATMLTGLLLTLSNAVSSILAAQYATRTNNGCYAGLIIMGITAGCHLNQYTALTFQYHPNNEFATGDAIGLGFGESDFVYGQEGIEAYHNLDKHTFVGNMRFYLFGPFYIAGGLAHQRGSTRSITFEAADRTIGNTLYEDISATVDTTLHDQTAPVLALGIHHFFFQRIGLIGEANFGLAFPKQLADVNITTSQPISEQDLALFKEAIRQDAESEGFGIATYGVTFSFSPPGLR